MFLVTVYAHMELRRKAVFGYAELDNTEKDTRVERKIRASVRLAMLRYPEEPHPLKLAIFPMKKKN